MGTAPAHARSGGDRTSATGSLPVDARSGDRDGGGPARSPDLVPVQRYADLRTRLDRLLDDGSRVLVVDMSAVAQVSSTTVATLLWTKQRCSARGMEVRLRHLSRRCFQALERVGLTHVLVVEEVGLATRVRRPSRPEEAAR
jgi:anti-anti-sigma regulatory factor